MGFVANLKMHKIVYLFKINRIFKTIKSYVNKTTRVKPYVFRRELLLLKSFIGIKNMMYLINQKRQRMEV